MKLIPIVAITVVVTICSAALWWLTLVPSDTSVNGYAAQSASSGAGMALPPGSGAGTLTGLGATVQTSLLNDSFLTSDLRQTFEVMLFEATGGSDIRDPALLKKLLAALVPRYFPNTLAARATRAQV